MEHVGNDGHDGQVTFANELSIWISKELNVSCVLLDWHDEVVLVLVDHIMRVTASSSFRTRHHCDEDNATCAIFDDRLVNFLSSFDMFHCFLALFLSCVLRCFLSPALFLRLRDSFRRRYMHVLQDSSELGLIGNVQGS